jgi:hypothetical protein
VTKESQLILLSPAGPLPLSSTPSAPVHLTLKNKKQQLAQEGRIQLLAGLSVPITLREEKKKRKAGGEKGNDTDSESEEEKEIEAQKKKQKKVSPQPSPLPPLLTD